MDAIEKKVINKLEKVPLFESFAKRWKEPISDLAQTISKTGKTLTAISASFIGIDQFLHILPQEFQVGVTTGLGYIALAGFVLTVISNLTVAKK